jgi:hypothetical protein
MKTNKSPFCFSLYSLASFNALDGIVSDLSARTCIQVDNLTPNHGSPSGGTAVIVNGSGFGDTPGLACAFGTSVVKATFGSAQQVACVAPAGQPDSSVDVKVTLDGTTFSASSASFRYDAAQCPTANCDGHGVCLAGKCVCNAGFSGDNCQTKACQPTCDPLHGTCVNGQCVCSNGWAGLD